MKQIQIKVWDKKKNKVWETNEPFNLVLYEGDSRAGFHLENENGEIIKGNFALTIEE